MQDLADRMRRADNVQMVENLSPDEKNLIDRHQQCRSKVEQRHSKPICLRSQNEIDDMAQGQIDKVFD
jgi:hypothetical protein